MAVPAGFQKGPSFAFFLSIIISVPSPTALVLQWIYYSNVGSPDKNWSPVQSWLQLRCTNWTHHASYTNRQQFASARFFCCGFLHSFNLLHDLNNCPCFPFSIYKKRQNWKLNLEQEATATFLPGQTKTDKQPLRSLYEICTTSSNKRDHPDPCSKEHPIQVQINSRLTSNKKRATQVLLPEKNSTNN